MQDPIAGPIVALLRQFGALPKAEADGWDGEPSAWADADSLTQRLSAFSQKNLGAFKQFVAEIVAGDFDAAQVDARLDAEIAASGVVMFSFTSCPFCKKAKELLDAKGAKYTVLELDLDSDGAALRARLGRKTGRTSVPAVWIDGTYVGGLNDGEPGLQPLETAGKLDQMLKLAKAV
ncbi:thioredoxin-like protein [Pelagophyceae sp. CCMP2097]|nr:thioredoxin-like protein [Pelagophyceae sp. CCMP2097]